jgi:hypothetical protein
MYLLNNFLNKDLHIIDNHLIHDNIHSYCHISDTVGWLRERGSGRGHRERAGLPGAKLAPGREARVGGVERRRGEGSTIHTLSKALRILDIDKMRAPL